MNKENNIKNIYLICSSIFTFLVALLLFMTVPKGYDHEYVFILIVIACFIFVMQVINNFKIRGRKNWFQIDIMFLIMYFFVHFWLWIATQFELTKTLWRSDLNNVNYSVVLSLLGMASFILGFNIKTEKGKSDSSKITESPQWKKIGNIVFYSGFFLTVLYAFYFGTDAFVGRYSGSEIGGLLTRSVYLLQAILLKLGILLILITNANKRRVIPNCKIPLFGLAIVLCMFLVSGDRSEFIYTLSVVIFAYSRYYKKITFSLLFIGVMLIALLMSAVQIARTADERSIAQIMEIITSDSKDVSVVDGLNGISASAGVLLAAVNAVPEKFDFFYGRLKKVELLGILPYGRALFLDNKIGKYGTSSEFLTWYILGPYSKTGTGTTIVADIYVDFGPPGVVIGLMLLGYIANFSCIRMNKSYSVESAVVFCYFAGLLMIMPRYSFLMVIRGLIWPILFLGVLKLFIPKLSR